MLLSEEMDITLQCPIERSSLVILAIVETIASVLAEPVGPLTKKVRRSLETQSAGLVKEKSEGLMKESVELKVHFMSKKLAAFV